MRLKNQKKKMYETYIYNNDNPSFILKIPKLKRAFYCHKNRKNHTELLIQTIHTFYPHCTALSVEKCTGLYVLEKDFYEKDYRFVIYFVCSYMTNIIINFFFFEPVALLLHFIIEISWVLLLNRVQPSLRQRCEPSFNLTGASTK